MITRAVTSRVAILDDYQRVALRSATWETLGDAVELTVFGDHLADDDAVAERLVPFEIVVAMRERTPLPRARLERLPNLRLLVTTGRANASIDMDAARELGVTVAGTDSLMTPTAELTWGLILALARHIPDEDARMRAGGWQHTLGTDLAGRTLGVVGLGRLGSQVAGIGRAFGMDVIAWSQNLEASHAASLDVEAVAKDELLRRADVVSIHLKLSDRSRGLVGAVELALMKPTAYLINTSRGPIVDEAALLDALHAGRIGGAGLDVFDTEPLPPEHPLRSAPRTVLTPHLGYVTSANYERFYTDVVAGITGFLNGSPVNVIN
jgi:phosphoglycerate dehydrogenase-like enzyme